ncbi:hypothetical protein [Luteimonas sp. MC1828]|uniref:hypothetical protein n=1 Tax=Luteimonas sp. MC1828 TaxID=2799787 RepID=UPI0018F12D39|nr:hypothetical protein [Luteimonas sp. MC1828]MBJ7576260.1 hypothetical protein [Luteimonas sp. MC1828]
MIYFATSRQSYDQLAASPAWPPAVLWVSLGVLASAELADLRAKGLAVTDFTNRVSPNDPAAMSDALDTIREHHPDHVVWVDGSVAA